MITNLPLNPTYYSQGARSCRSEARLLLGDPAQGLIGLNVQDKNTFAMQADVGSRAGLGKMMVRVKRMEIGGARDANLQN